MLGTCTSRSIYLPKRPGNLLEGREFPAHHTGICFTKVKIPNVSPISTQVQLPRGLGRSTTTSFSSLPKGTHETRLCAAGTKPRRTPPQGNGCLSAIWAYPHSDQPPGAPLDHVWARLPISPLPGSSSTCHHNGPVHKDTACSCGKKPDAALALKPPC